MGILKQHIHMFGMEQERYSFIKGDVLTLGQQAIYCTVSDASSILGSYNCQLSQLPTGIDVYSKIPGWKGTVYEKNTNAEALFKLLGAANVYAADVSTYENPDVLIDLNIPIEDKYLNKFDTIIDVGTLEHVFDICTALNNLCNMLKIGGCIALILPCSNAIDHGFYSFSPTLMFDYFSANGFGNFSCYLREGSPFLFERKGRLFKYARVDKEIPLLSCRGIEVAFFATKESDTTPRHKPIQSVYQTSDYWKTGSLPERSGLYQMVKKCLISIARCSPFFVEKRIFLQARGKNITMLGKY